MSQTRGRAIKLTPEIADSVTTLVTAGVTIMDACLESGISDRTFYNWRLRGRALAELQEAEPDTLFDDEAKAFISFFRGVTRAEAASRIAAVAAVRNAMSGGEEVTETTETITHTKLRKIIRTYTEPATDDHPARVVTQTEEVPYEERTIRKGRSVRQLAPDPSIALEFLARRDRETWGKRAILEVDWREHAIMDIRTGKLEFEMLSNLFDADEAAELYREAGLEPPDISYTLPPGERFEDESGGE